MFFVTSAARHNHARLFSGGTMPFINLARAPFAAALIALASMAAGLPGRRTGPGVGAGGRTRSRRHRAGARRGTATRTDGVQGSRRQPLRSRSAVEAGRLRLPRHADHPGHHVDGQLVHHLHQGLRAEQADQAAPRTANESFWTAGSIRKACDGLHEGQRLPLHRRKRAQGQRPPRGHAGRDDRQAHLDQHEHPARRRQHQQPPAGRPGVPGHGGLDGAVRRPLRHGLGHLPRADRHRRRRARPRSTRSPARSARR